MNKIVIIREGFIRSIIADMFTFGLMGLLLVGNYKYFGDHGAVAFLIVFLAISFTLMKGLSKKNTFHTLEDAIKYIESLTSEDDLGESCPTCGYYCTGKGGMGCIDKPSMINNNKECGCICHKRKHLSEEGLVHDALCCDKMNGSLDLSGVLKERDEAYLIGLRK